MERRSQNWLRNGQLEKEPRVPGCDTHGSCQQLSPCLHPNIGAAQDCVLGMTLQGAQGMDSRHAMAPLCGMRILPESTSMHVHLMSWCRFVWTQSLIASIHAISLKFSRVAHNVAQELSRVTW